MMLDAIISPPSSETLHILANCHLQRYTRQSEPSQHSIKEFSGNAPRLLVAGSEFKSLDEDTRGVVPSPPEASSSPPGLKRTTLTALVCLARLERKSTTAFPSGPVSTRHTWTPRQHTVISLLALTNDSSYIRNT